MEDRKHHPYSPSTLQSLEACPCYRGKESKHVRTIIGTIAHSVAESGKDDNRLADADAEAAAECLDFVEERRRIFEAQRAKAVDALTVELWGKDLGPGQPTYDCQAVAQQRISPVIEIKESYLPVDDVNVIEDWTDPATKERSKVFVASTTAGYVDHGFISHDQKYAEIYDWKFGLWPVEDAENNLQGLAYLLGMFKAYPTVEKATFFFKQPLLGSLTHATLTRADIPKVMLRIRVVVNRAAAARMSGSFDSANPMVPNCNFCANIGICPKVAAFACKVGHKFYPLAIPADITPTKVLDPKDTALGLRLAAVMEVWAGGFRTQTTNRVLRGEAPTPEGYAIQSRSTREVVDVNAFKQVALKYITEDEYKALQEAPGFGKIEDLIQDKTPRGQKKGKVIEFNAELKSAGATQENLPYSFLKAVAKKKEGENENKPSN